MERHIYSVRTPKRNSMDVCVVTESESDEGNIMIELECSSILNELRKEQLSDLLIADAFSQIRGRGKISRGRYRNSEE